MDQIKIGKYIADKRKALGLTQVELAEKLGMSNKSVSKWERGVCLPDVSVYEDLCGVLGISLNEFIAGEDLGLEDVVPQSEKNLIDVSQDSVQRRRKLRKIMALLLAVLILLGGIFGWFLYKEGYFLGAHIRPYDPNSAEYKVASMIAAQNSPFLYEYTAPDTCRNVTFTVYEYHKEQLLDEPLTVESNLSDEKSGSLAVVQDIRHGELKLIAASDTGEASGTVENNREIREAMSVSAAWTGIDEILKIEPDKEYPLCAFYSSGGEVSCYPVEMAIPNEKDLDANEYTLLVTVRFGTEETEE
jgi:transcriptional regulator with XRE-family HTH domain